MFSISLRLDGIRVKRIVIRLLYAGFISSQSYYNHHYLAAAHEANYHSFVFSLEPFGLPF